MDDGEQAQNGYKGGGYGKRPLWQWILLYVVIGGALYAAVYYYYFRDSGYSYDRAYSPSQSGSTTTSQSGYSW